MMGFEYLTSVALNRAREVPYFHRGELAEQGDTQRAADRLRACQTGHVLEFYGT